MNIFSSRFCQSGLLLVLLLSSLAICKKLRSEDQGKKSEALEYPLPMEISQEPLIFQIRRGTASTDEAERWKLVHTEENVKKIAETGRMMLYTHFYKGYGLHGTYWHNNFGYPMSHGCINLRIDDAGWIYNWAVVGTVINIHQ